MSPSVTNTGLQIGRRLYAVVGFFSGWRILLLAVPLAGGLLTGGFVAGMKWQQGLHAMSVLASVDAQLDRFEEDLERNDEAARRFEELRTEISAFYQARDADFQEWSMANRDRLAECGIGVDGLRLWNLWNQGPAAGTDQP